MSELQKLKQRVAELEAEIGRLKARPVENHYHYHQTPVYQPFYPSAPAPSWCEWPTIDCDGSRVLL